MQILFYNIYNELRNNNVNVIYSNEESYLQIRVGPEYRYKNIKDLVNGELYHSVILHEVKNISINGKNNYNIDITKIK